jgi:hypothetical protein
LFPGPDEGTEERERKLINSMELIAKDGKSAISR